MSEQIPPILALPRELLDTICLYIPTKDLKNMSLVSNSCRPSSAQRALFRTAYLEIHLNSFAKLHWITSDALLRTYVRHIVYLRGEINNLFIDDRFDQVADIYEQWATEPYHKDFAKVPLSSMMEKLPGLKHLRGNCEGYRKYNMKAPIAWTLLSSIYHANPLRSLERLDLYHIRPLDWINGLDLLQKFFTAWKHLSSLTLSFVAPRSVVPEEFAGLRPALSNLISLPELTISYDEVARFNANFRLTSFLSPKQHWKFLKSLSLQGLVIVYQDLISILSIHSKSLRSLELKRIRLANFNPYKPISWVQVFFILE